MKSRICFPKNKIELFCREQGIRKLSIYDSALRNDFGPDSDVDILVEFEQDRIPSLLGMARMEMELSEMIDGRKVDLRTPEDLSRYFRHQVLEEAEVQYVVG